MTRPCSADRAAHLIVARSPDRPVTRVALLGVHRSYFYMYYEPDIDPFIELVTGYSLRATTPLGHQPPAQYVGGRKPGKSLGADIRKSRPNHNIVCFFLSIKFMATLFFKCPMGLDFICET